MFIAMQASSSLSTLNAMHTIEFQFKLRFGLYYLDFPEMGWYS